MIKNIIFDIGNVLVRYDPEDTLRKAGIPEPQIVLLLNATINNCLWKEMDRGFIPEEVIVEKMIEQNPEMETLIHMFFAHTIYDMIEPAAYARGWLAGLKKRGYRIYLLTNYPKELFDAHCKSQFTFMEYVDGQIVSGEVQQIKPDPDIYRCLLQKYGLRAEECVFIDDHSENVLAAQYMGMRGIHFINYEDTGYVLENMLEA